MFRPSALSPVTIRVAVEDGPTYDYLFQNVGPEWARTVSVSIQFQNMQYKMTLERFKKLKKELESKKDRCEWTAQKIEGLKKQISEKERLIEKLKQVLEKRNSCTQK